MRSREPQDESRARARDARSWAAPLVVSSFACNCDMCPLAWPTVLFMSSPDGHHSGHDDVLPSPIFITSIPVSYSTYRAEASYQHRRQPIEHYDHADCYYD